MSLTLQTEPLPLRVDAGGAVRVGNTRVTLESVIYAYKQGASAEQIVEMFDSLVLADVHAVIAYYLHHKDEVEAYLRQYEREVDEIRRQIEARFDPTGIRERLLARRQLQKG